MRGRSNSREHNLAASMVARWRQKYDARGEAAFASPEPTHTQSLVAKVAELEQFYGQLAIENIVLKKRCGNIRRAPARSDQTSET